MKLRKKELPKYKVGDIIIHKSLEDNRGDTYNEVIMSKIIRGEASIDKKGKHHRWKYLVLATQYEKDQPSWGVEDFLYVDEPEVLVKI